MNDNASKISEALISLAIAVLSGLGVGSGGLLVIWLTLLKGVSPETARGLNLLFFVFSASAALLVHCTKGKIRLGTVSLLSALACIGTLVGVTVGSAIEPSLLRKIFGAMLILSGGYTVFGKIRAFVKSKAKAHLDNVR